MTTHIEKIIGPINEWYQTSSIHAFFSWWTAELKSIVPKQYREGLFLNSIEVFIYQAASDEAVQLWQYQDGLMKQIEFDDSVEGKEWWHKLNHFVAGSEQEIKITYLMDESEVLSREIALPVVAINEISSVLTFELDKYIPFKADDVDFDFRKGKIEEGSEKFPVYLTAIRKQQLKTVIEQTENKGVALSAVDVNTSHTEVPEPLGVNLLPKELRKKKNWTAIKWYAALVFVAVTLLGFVMYGSLQNKRTKIESLETQVEALKKDARRAKMIESQLNDSVQAANFLGNLKKNKTSRVKLIAELTEKIPTNSYLSRIIIDDEKIEVVGESDNANSLVPILNQSDLWFEPKIIGNVTQNPRNQKEKFTIKSELKPAEVEALEVTDES